jgi:hypothetical protein
MKINYRTHPILEKLHKKVLGKIPIMPEDQEYIESNYDSLELLWSGDIEKYQSEIISVSMPFVEASEKASAKLMRLYDDIITDKTIKFNVYGTYIIKDFVFMINYNLLEGQHDFVLFIFSKAGMLMLFAENRALNYENENNYVWTSDWVVKALNIETENQRILFLHNQLSMLLSIYMFRQYAEVETKVLEPHNRVIDIGCKYINETSFKITYLDSKWFTSLVKSDGFKVRGHFRLQPKKKDGKWTHELIYIEDFMKTGYTSKARKLNL